MFDMPTVLPADFTADLQQWAYEANVSDAAEVIRVVQETWDLQTFSNLEQGRVAVPDDVINKSLAAMMEEGGPVREMTVTSLPDNKIKITAQTQSTGRVVLVCKIEQFEHDKDHSLIKLKALDKKLPDKPIMSWIFARVSLAMAAKITGGINPGHGLNLNLRGNEATIDFHQALYQSRFGMAQLFGYRLVDFVSVAQAVPHDGYVEFETTLNLPDQIKTMVKNVLNVQS